MPHSITVLSDYPMKTLRDVPTKAGKIYAGVLASAFDFCAYNPVAVRYVGKANKIYRVFECYDFDFNFSQDPIEVDLGNFLGYSVWNTCTKYMSTFITKNIKEAIRSA